VKKVIIAVATVAALVGSPVWAADLAVKAPSPAAATAYNWSGPYWGLNAGYGFANQTATENDNPPLLVNIPAAQRIFTFNRDGAIAGGQIGYNWQIARPWLVGVEADLDWADVKGNDTSTFLFGGAFPGAFTASSRLEWFGTLRGRLGLIVDDRLLVFGTGGLAYGETKFTGSIVNNFGAPLVLSAGASPICANNAVCYQGSTSKTSAGWVVGAGLEYAVWNNVTLKAEYLYVDLGSDTMTLGPTAAISGGAPASATYKFSDTVANIVRGGFNVKF
jgi:outer membrane immunogenic protein